MDFTTPTAITFTQTHPVVKEVYIKFFWDPFPHTHTHIRFTSRKTPKLEFLLT